ncbi:MAG TPA: hemolysin secretion protein D [Armatimonadetes bacterium]|nr:hemolysin secretion protein D [Armatimonadota bacterium]
MRDAEQQVALSRAQAKQAADAAQKQLAEAERAADAARANLGLMLAGTREERVRQARAAEAAAESQVRAARDTLAAAEASHRDRLEARSGLQAAQTAVNTSRATAEAAKADLDLLIAGNRETVIQQAEGRLAEAQAALEAAQVKRAYCDIKAPCTGTVTEVVALAGEMLAAGAPVVVVTDLAHLSLRAYVGFEQLGAIKQGQSMQVSTQAVPGRTFSGQVTRISDKAEFTPKDVQTPDQRMDQVYWVKIALGDGEGLLKPGMPADVVATD